MSFSFPTDWKVTPADAYCVRVADGTHDSPKFLDHGHPLVTSKNVKNGRIDLSGANLISKADFDEINKRSMVHQWDVIITMIGTVGEVCLVQEKSPPYAIKNVGLFKCNGDHLAASWLYYWLSSPVAQQLIHARKKGTTQQYISLGELRKLPIAEPASKFEKERIVAVLRSLDERISLLRETNATLEAIAQALFKSWFVDFDPVRAKQEGREPEGMNADTAVLFPEALEKSELGPIPKGWQWTPFGKLLGHTIGGDWGADSPDEKNDTQVAIIRGTDIPDLHAGAASRVPIRYTSGKKLATRELQDGDIVLEVSGGSKDQPTGRSLFITDRLLSQFGCPVEPASFCRLLRPKDRETGVLLGQHLSYIYRQGKTWEYQNQSTGISNFQTTHFLESELVALPNESVLSAFASIVRPLIERTQLSQIRRLADLRDTLLPRLISGQLRLPEAEDQFHEALTGT